MLSQIIRVVLNLCGQRNLITTAWKDRESYRIFIIKQNGSPIKVIYELFFNKAKALFENFITRSNEDMMNFIIKFKLCNYSPEILPPLPSPPSPPLPSPPLPSPPLPSPPLPSPPLPSPPLPSPPLPSPPLPSPPLPSGI